MLNMMVIFSHSHRQIYSISPSKVRYNRGIFPYVLANNYTS